MKVRDALNNTLGISGAPFKDDKKVSAGKGADFRNELMKAEGNSYEQHIENLVNKIVQQSEKLSQKVDIKELMVYRKLVAEFLEVALGNSRKFSKQSLLDRRGRHKVYALIKKINTELDSLMQDVMNGEKDNIIILQRVDDIRGMILDMVL